MRVCFGELVVVEGFDYKSAFLTAKYFMSQFNIDYDPDVGFVDASDPPEWIVEFEHATSTDQGKFVCARNIFDGSFVAIDQAIM